MVNAGPRAKFGCHDFINSKPITRALVSGAVPPPFDMTLAPPSALADMLAGGELDFAIIPSIEFARYGGYMISDVAAISSAGPVWTVLYFTRKEFTDIRTVAIDTNSRTSAAMLKILLRERFGLDPKYIHHQPEPERMLVNADAGMIIGDAAFPLRNAHAGYNILDIGEEWYRLTGKTLVHALLAIRPGTDCSAGCHAISQSLKNGIASLPEIAREESKKHGLPEDVIFEYLSSRIRYGFGDAEADGLREFFRLAWKHGLIESEPELRMVC